MNMQDKLTNTSVETLQQRPRYQQEGQLFLLARVPFSAEIIERSQFPSH